MSADGPVHDELYLDGIPLELYKQKFEHQGAIDFIFHTPSRVALAAGESNPPDPAGVRDGLVLAHWRINNMAKRIQADANDEGKTRCRRGNLVLPVGMLSLGLGSMTPPEDLFPRHLGLLDEWGCRDRVAEGAAQRRSTTASHDQ